MDDLRHVMALHHCREPSGVGNSELSEVLGPPIAALYPNEDRLHARLQRFCADTEGRIEWLYSRHGDDTLVAPLLSQPELPAILELLETDPTGLLRVWPTEVPHRWLEALAEAWGAPL